MLKNMKITRQVMAGFGLILLMLALFAAFTWNQLNSLRSIQQATRSSSVLAMRVMDVNQAVTETRMAFDRFIESARPQDSEALLAEMHEVRAIAVEIEQQDVPDADRLVALKDRHIQEVSDFASNFTKQAQRVAQIRELGVGMRADFDEVQQLLASRASQDQSLAVLRAAGAFSLARIRTEEFLTARGQETYDNAEVSFEELKANMSALNPSLLPTDAGALLTKVRGEIDEYWQIITAIHQEEPALTAAMEKVVATTTETVTLTAEIRNAAVARKEALDAQATTISRATISSVLIGVALAILLGTFVAGLLTHALSKGLSRTVDQTRRLATGDLDVEITGNEGRNELAELARALSIFKDNALERLRLAAEARRMTEASVAAREAEMKEQARVVRDIGDGLNRLAGGDLTTQIQSPTSDPFPAGYETLRAAFNSVLATLSGTMSRIGDVSDQVRGGSDEITSAAHDLSSRAETQAATLEQSAAALNEMSESVRSTAERARQAEQASQQNREIAETSSAIVRDAVEAMKGIEKSSDQITRIIGVIDDIAFQTNLLALNAGVEAARAGEAGRGFAVVASEVRGLAQRASDSAREIKVLISDSAAQVKAGSSLVGRTGESLDLILGRAREVSEQVSAIARAANEQAIGLSEINAGVNQLDQVTQQNAAVAEQTNAAAVSLQQRAEDLMREISAFRVEGKARAPMARPQRARSNTPDHTPTGLRVVAGRGDVAGQLYEF